MRRVLPLKLLLAVLLAACVTVNVYFPAAEAAKAADQLLDQIQGTSAPPANSNQSSTPKPQGSTATPADRNVLLAAAGNLLELLIPSANAQGAANVDINTPEIRAITGSMAARFQQLRPYFESGAVGYTADGHIDIRDANAVPLPERANVKRLVAEDNRDREALWTEMARANGHPEWKSDLQATFARRQIDKAFAGFHYQDASGAWKQK
jgi:uncharacterized protein YdbL (DUF1318 family)